MRHLRLVAGPLPLPLSSNPDRGTIVAQTVADSARGERAQQGRACVAEYGSSAPGMNRYSERLAGQFSGDPQGRSDRRNCDTALQVAQRDAAVSVLDQQDGRRSAGLKKAQQSSAQRASMSERKREPKRGRRINDDLRAANCAISVPPFRPMLVTSQRAAVHVSSEQRSHLLWQGKCLWRARVRYEKRMGAPSYVAARYPDR